MSRFDIRIILGGYNILLDTAYNLWVYKLIINTIRTYRVTHLSKLDQIIFKFNLD
ncbi:unnamed protein product [Arabidopsis halleri]